MQHHKIPMSILHAIQLIFVRIQASIIVWLNPPSWASIKANKLIKESAFFISFDIEGSLSRFFGLLRANGSFRALYERLILIGVRCVMASLCSGGVRSHLSKISAIFKCSMISFFGANLAFTNLFTNCLITC